MGGGVTFTSVSENPYRGHFQSSKTLVASAGCPSIWLSSLLVSPCSYTDLQVSPSLPERSIFKILSLLQRDLSQNGACLGEGTFSRTTQINSM